MKEIIVTTQEQLNAIEADFDGRVIIRFGTPDFRAVVSRSFRYPVVAWGNISVVARGNSSVVARGNSSVEAWGNGSVEAYNNSSVVAYNNSSVVAWGNSSVEARGDSSVEARDNSSVVAWGNSSVVARGNSSVEARGDSSVEAYDNSFVEAWGNSFVKAWDNSSVEAWGNVQLLDKTSTHKLSITGNARIVYDPRNISEYIDFYGIESDGKTAKLFKAVHKRDGGYFSDYGNFEYRIGEIAVADSLDTNPREDCGHGIHMAHKAWCLDYGRDWDDLAILEVEAEMPGIIVPEGNPGKVRAAQVKMLREVPLSECGLMGKLLEKRRTATP